ncbi:cpsA domain protein [Rhodococcus sp. MTM3W5.2]|uniref:LCP family protein n=1 Tax=Rhodococcus sp. MTM3W5.2 TaxID=1805827 RepID=UPI00097954D4|nr:LCP family protein [Rhodococcus sp. MTM3W5.2]AQA26022.1 cpsA domain protein [Rhodococcus sp. MTM3W5.2]
MRLLSASLSAMVLGGVGLGWAAQSHLTSGLQFSDALDALAGAGPKSRHGDANILLIGLDSRKAMDGSDLPAQFVTDELHAGDSGVGGYNTNTLILLHVPGDGSRATAAAIPRDDYVSVPGTGCARSRRPTVSPRPTRTAGSQRPVSTTQGNGNGSRAMRVVARRSRRCRTCCRCPSTTSPR